MHWHEEATGKGRNSLVESVASIHAQYLVVVRLGDAVVMESRGPSDRLDRQLVDTMRAKKMIDAALRVDHLPGPSEPLLWVPDVICGSVAQERYGNPLYMDQLRKTTAIIHI